MVIKNNNTSHQHLDKKVVADTKSYLEEKYICKLVIHGLNSQFT